MTGSASTQPSILLITGEKGAGKTRWCESLIASGRAAGQDMAGLISPAVYTEGRKTGIRVRDIRSGEERVLATPRAGPATDDAPRGWVFDEAGLAWANARLEEVGPCHTLMVDEIGPLELEQERGWISVWPVLKRRAFVRAVLVVRPPLLGLAKDRIREIGDFDLDVSYVE